MRIKGLGLAAFSKLLLQRRKVNHRRNVFICVADHFEPDWGGASETLRRERVQRWVDQYPISVEGIRDSRGRVPQHTFFYPLEEYRSELINGLAELCHSGYGDVEVHLHHQDDTEENLFKQLDWFRRTLYHKHNLLRTDRKGQIRFGFIHGNWALCNSLPDGAWCGVNDEIRVLREAGCYADFTLPAAPSPAQTSSVNRIYYAHSDANRPKAHDTGPAATVGVPPVKDALLMIPGPLALDWSSRKKLCIPSLENADLSASRPPAPSRISNWERASVTVKGRPELVVRQAAYPWSERG